MYQQANETINEGLSFGARITLGFFAGLFGVVMVLVAPPTDKAVYFYMFGAFCLLIAVACITKGRVRQFVGSVIGGAIFFMALVYVVFEVTAGVFWSGARSESSVINALMFFVFFGIPGAAYVYKVRFGFHKKP